MRLGSGAAGNGLGLACLLLLLLQALSGAASAPGGVLLGAPSLAAIVVASAVLFALRRLCGPSLGRWGLGLLPFLAALAFVAWLPGAAAWTGAPLFAPVLGAALLASWSGLEGKAVRKALVPALFVAYACAAARVQLEVGAEGDEPHYLMVAESLLRDGDLQLERDYAERRYAAFSRQDELLPHYRVRGKGGEIYSLHAVGLSLLVLPAYALFGYAGASFFMALLLALLVGQVRALIESWLGESAPATATAWLVGLSPPLVHYAGLVFTEVPAALLLTVALRLASEADRLRGRRLAGLLLALAFLPWLNVRYVVLAVLALGYAFWRRPARASVALLATGAVASAAALGLYHFALYGFFDPRRVYGVRPELELSLLPEGLPGLFLDQEFGLFVYAPIFAVAAVGLLALARQDRARSLLALALVASSVGLAGAWHMWRGGFNPPARFLVPVVPPLAVGLACVLRNGLPSPAALLAGWGLWAGVVGACEPRLVHRDRDGTAPFFRRSSGAEEWTRLLPGYVLSHPDRGPLALVWALALGGAAAASLRRGMGRPAGLAAAGAAAIAAAGIASSLSHEGSRGRDAVRVIGRSAVAVPSLHLFSVAPARWGAAALEWGPVYEPHRHPQGAPLGERLPLPAGRYRVKVLADVLGDGLPALLVLRDGDARPRTRTSFAKEADGLAASLDVGPSERPLTLALQGGPSLIVRELRIEPSTFAP